MGTGSEPNTGNGIGTGAIVIEQTKKWSKFTLLHTSQMIGAVVIILGTVKAFGVPAAREFIVQATDSRIGQVEKSLNLYDKEQRAYRSEATRRTNEVINRQQVIIESQKLRAEHAKQAQEETQRLLRILIQQRASRPNN